jgi:8-oxo-dGTP diphosphatase
VPKRPTSVLGDKGIGMDDAVPSAIVACSNLIMSDQGTLLVRESKPSARQRYNLPAGKVEMGESLIEAAVREAKEETGLDVVPDHLVGVYHCPETSEGGAVVNFVFSSVVTGGALRTSDEHPEVRYFTKPEVQALGASGMLRGNHIELAIDQHERGVRLPLDIVQLVPASPPGLIRSERR